MSFLINVWTLQLRILISL